MTDISDIEAKMTNGITHASDIAGTIVEQGHGCFFFFF